MPRLFLGIDLPDAIDFDLQLMAGGIPGARWQSAEQLHLTLHFLGDLTGGDARRLRAALAQLEAPSFTMQLRGTGVFPLRGPARTLWIGVSEPDPIRLIHDRSARIIDELGLPRERRKFMPHVTIARLHNPDPRRLGEWVTHHALYASAPFLVDEVRLYSSVLSHSGAKYRTEAVFALEQSE